MKAVATREALNWSLAASRTELGRLIADGVGGSYRSVEVTELFGWRRGETPFNLLSVLVLEETTSGGAEDGPRYLNREPIRLSGLKTLAFGVRRFVLPVVRLDEILERYAREGVWAPAGEALQVGELEAQRPEFAPSDGTVSVPLNGVLKNNFWAGSHLFHLACTAQENAQPLLDDPRRLQALSQAISPFVPWRLAGLSDLLGDVLIQLPVLSVTPNIHFDPEACALDVDLTWRRGTNKRKLLAAVDVREDELVAGAAVSPPFSDRVELNVPAHLGSFRVHLWDEVTGDLLAATAPTGLVNRIQLGLHVVRPEPRLFWLKDDTGANIEHRVSLSHAPDLSMIGEAEPLRDARRRRRIELGEARRLETTRDFVQYRPRPGSTDERKRALDDVRRLINAHGRNGVWLWDPYLSALDILQTLFFSPHVAADLRALTSGRSPPTSTAPAPFARVQQETFKRLAGNREGLKLEYRNRTGPEGWDFHDRFLIFPQTDDGPLAWSLGTSVNSLGAAHHILQRVANGALISGAFDDLWAALDKPAHLIWRSW